MPASGVMPVQTVAGDAAMSPDVEWIVALTATGAIQAQAMAELHALMIRAAAHQVWRMGEQLAGLDRQSIDVLINQSADEAMTSVLRKLDTFAGRSRFTTWAYKFAILQAASDVHRAAWHDREVALDEGLQVPDQASSPAEQAEAADLSRAISAAIDSVLTRRQRQVVTALLIDHVPIDVLADRLATNRNALYKTLHDARVRLRTHLVATGHVPSADLAASPVKKRKYAPGATRPHTLEGGHD